MTTRRWVQLAAFVVLFFVTRNAGAVVIGVCNSTNCSGAKTSAVGNVVVAQTGTNSDVYLTSDTQNYNADLVISACSSTNGGTGTFTAKVGGVATGIQLKNNQNNVVDVTYMPTTRGNRTCTVTVYPAGMTTGSLGSFTITGNGVAPVINSPAPLAFAAVRYNDAAAVHTQNLNLNIQNTSGDAGQVLTINNVTLSGTGMADYSITPPGTNAINPGATGTWIVTFDPLAAGASSATITIDSNDPVTPSRTVTVSGTGGTAVIGVTATLAFGTINQGTTSATSNVVISNNGAGTKAAMGVTQAAFVNNNASWFKFNQAGCIGSTTTCALSYSLVSTTGTVGVQCAPPAGATGSQTAQIAFTSDADDNSANTTNVSCTAGRADIVVTTTPLAFGNQLINTTSSPQTVMIQNTGNATLTYSVALAGVDPTQFTLAGAGGCTSNCSVSAMSSVMVTLYFSPNAMGDKNAVLRVSPANDPDTAGPIDVALSGTCIAPIASYNVTSMAFGNIEAGTTATAQTLTVSNTGTANLIVSAASLVAGAGQYVVPTGTTGSPLTTAITVAPNASASWTIACKPTAQGSVPGTFRVTTNTSQTPLSQDVALSCNGMKGNLVIVASSFDFGQKLEGSMTPQNFTLTNTGNLPVTNINYTTTGTGTGYSILTPTFPYASLAPNASVTVTVQFYPLNGNDGGPYTYTFAGVWGTGNVPTSAALALNGDGLTTGFDTSPSNPYPLDWGDIRFDTPTNQMLNVVNTAGTGYNIMSLSITPDVNTASSELAIVNCRKGASPAVTTTTNGCPSGTTYYASSGANDTMTVNIQCHPNNRVGMVGGTITIHTSLPLNPDRTVALKCNATTAVLDLAPGTVVDFGPIDLDVTPTATTRTVTLKNTGAAPMNIGTVTKTVAGPFVFTATPATPVSPSGTYSFDVTYTPTAERAPNQPETATVVLPLAGAIGTPGSVTVSISGYGVDRHIALAPAPVFPNTFKNPGDKAPVLPVTITNNGDANLNVSAVMLSDYPIWTVDNPDATDVSGRQSYDFNVRFQPVTAGKAPTGHMVIMNNDNGKPVVTVDFDGIGLDRLVEFGPNEINLGYVGIGISTRLSEAGLTLDTTSMQTPVLSLDVTNHEMAEPFDLTAMTITGGDGAFRVLDAIDDHEIGAQEQMQLAAQSTHKFDVVFTPNHEGDFVADVNLYLDHADDPHSTVRLRGRGLYVDVRGGGGCSTGRGNGAGALLLVLGALLVGRRRRGVLGLLGVLGATSAARAETRNLDTALFDPTPATQVTALQSQSADVGKNGDYAISALFTYADNPLVLKSTQNTYVPVDNRSMLVLGGAYAFGERFEAGLRMPLYLQNGQATGNQNQMFQVVQIDSVSRGDATVHVKMNGGATEALGGDLSYGAAFALSIPTRSSSDFAGTNMPQGRLLGLATLTKGRLVLQTNAGGIIRSKERYSSLVQRSGVTFAVGGTYRAGNKLWIGGEAFGNLIPGGKTGDPEGMDTYGPPELSNSIEGLAELTYRMSRTATLGVALGRGITSGVGTSNVRGALMLSFTPGADAMVPLPKKIHIEGPNDKDGDGVKDKLDACANEPEDKDMFEDGDGCPDLDNDNDGISDDKDKCALDAEDRDRYEDDDGCPERDNDNDGVLDEQDKCPIAAEDKDGFQDTDGCAEPDNDNDGIVDKADKCPIEAETINGNADDDGCPDKGDALVVLSPDRVDLLDNIQFENGSKLARASKNILGQIGATLRAHPEILRIRLTAHVQPSGSAAKDMALSEARAKAVREWLVDWGIDPLRLQSSGFGGSKPLVDPKSKGAQSINDRFELIVLERK